MGGGAAEIWTSAHMDLYGILTLQADALPDMPQHKPTFFEITTDYDQN